MRHPTVHDLSDVFQLIESAGIRRIGKSISFAEMWNGVSSGLRKGMETTPATLAPGAVANLR
jgi:hypothetical protein